MWQSRLQVQTRGKGLYLITDQIAELIPPGSRGLLNLFIQHTSASLLIQENADPTARQDLEEFFDRIAPENESWHRHTLEGPDDTTSHLKAALTQVSLTIPIVDGGLCLGTWQGIYLFEHRKAAHSRNVLLSILS